MSVDNPWTVRGLSVFVDIAETHLSYCWATVWKLPGCCREVARQLRGYCAEIARDIARTLPGNCPDDSADVAWILHDLLPYSLIRGWCLSKMFRFSISENRRHSRSTERIKLDDVCAVNVRF